MFVLAPTVNFIVTLIKNVLSWCSKIHSNNFYLLPTLGNTQVLLTPLSHPIMASIAPLSVGAPRDSLHGTLPTKDVEFLTSNNQPLDTSFSSAPSLPHLSITMDMDTNVSIPTFKSGNALESLDGTVTQDALGNNNIALQDDPISQTLTSKEVVLPFETIPPSPSSSIDTPIDNLLVPDGQTSNTLSLVHSVVSGVTTRIWGSTYTSDRWCKSAHPAKPNLKYIKN